MSSMSPISSTYQDVEKFLYNMVHKEVRRSNLPFDELLSQANLGFMQAYHSYDPGVGEFITWVGNKVKHRINDLYRGLTNQRRKNVTNEIEMDSLPQKEFDRFDMGEWAKDLSPDARLVVMLVFHPPIDVRANLADTGGTLPWCWRLAIRDFLSECGWTSSRIMDVFREIKGAL